MAITKIDNQAVTLVTPGQTFQDLNQDCNCRGKDFCQLVESSDNTCFQVDLTESTGVELVTAGDFSTGCGVDWTCGATWSIAAGIASKAAGGSNLTQDIGVIQGRYYKVTATISNFSGLGAQISLGGQFAMVVTTNGTFTVYKFLNAPINSLVLATTSAAGDTYDLDNVSVKEMSSIAFNIKDDDDVIVYEENDGSSVTYSSTDDVPPIQNATVSKAIVCIDWANDVVNDGCFHLCIIDISLENTELITDGGFTAACGVNWVCDAKWSIAAGIASFNNGGLPGPETERRLRQTLSLAAGKCYDMTFTISGYVSGSLSVKVSGGETIQSGISGNGAKSVFIDLRGKAAATSIFFLASNGATDRFDIDDVSIKLADECKTVIYESECFKLGTFDCSVLFTATNDENAYGLDYENLTYVQSFRHCAKLWKPLYPKEKETHRSSDGDRDIHYSSTTKVERLTLEEMPEYLHDFFSIALEHDTLTIDAVEYVNEQDDYEPVWRNSSLLAPAEVEVIKDLQNLVNANC